MSAGNLHAQQSKFCRAPSPAPANAVFALTFDLADDIPGTSFRLKGKAVPESRNDPRGRGRMQ
jgi:hypothetical protein